MALIACKECNKEISSSVKQCPNCGSNKHRNFLKKHPIISVIGIAFIIGSIPKFLLNDNSNVGVKPVKAITSSPHHQAIVQESQKEETNWNYDVEEDKMRGTKDNFATTESTNTLQLGFPYNDSKMEIILRKKDNENDVMLSVKGQIVCNELSERCYVDAKFDNSEIRKFDFIKADHSLNKLVFIKNEKEFIDLLKHSKKVIIEVPLFNSGRQEYEFNIENLKWDN